jgi:hypothetical protein
MATSWPSRWPRINALPLRSTDPTAPFSLDGRRPLLHFDYASYDIFSSDPADKNNTMP